MRPRISKFAIPMVLTLGLACFQHSRLAADDAKAPPKELPDYSKYKFVKEVTGEVVKADDKKITIRVKSSVNANKNVKQLPKLVDVNKDYEYQFIPESLVRTDTLPVKKDENGKKVAYTQAEKDALKVPKGVKGYAASISDLKEGKTVNLILIRDKKISDDEAKESDLRVKFAIIEAQPPPQNQ